MAARTPQRRRRSPVSRAVIRKIVREELTLEPEMVRLTTAMILCDETSVKRTLTLLDKMNVPVREGSERRHYVLVAELRAGMRALPVSDRKNKKATEEVAP